MIKTFTFLLLMIILSTAVAQQKFTLSGKVTDAETGEDLIGCNVCETTNLTGVFTNNYGFYSLTLPMGKIKIAWSFVGYETVYRELDLTDSQKIDIQLRANSQIGEVTVTGNRALERIATPQISRIDLSIDKIKTLPAILGESDVMKALQMLPGVQGGSEGNTGLYVRGGTPDQNLILLDGVTVYNASHLYGFFSVFNPDALKSVTLYKGGFPARFGGRLSSVVDVRMKEGNDKAFHGDYSIGIISSKINYEGPIVKDRTSFNISARRTYLDILAKPFINDDVDEGIFGYNFYDLNAKINHKFSDRSRLFLSTYIGRDNYKEDSKEYSTYQKAKINWGNITNALRWNYTINNKLFSNSTATYSRYNYLIGSENDSEYAGFEDYFKYEYQSGIYDYSYNLDFDYFPSPNHAVKFGINYINHTFKPGVNTLKSRQENTDPVNSTFGDKKIYANEFAAYIEDEFAFLKKFKANIGFHASGFSVQKSFYKSLEPRLSLRYLANENLSFKAAYSQMKQYIHMLSSSTINMPTDLWVPVTDKVKPQNSEQYAVGTNFTLPYGLNMTIEGFYKKMNNLIEYKDGASYIGTTKGWEDKIESGKGWSYGGEFLLNKEIGKTTGWIGYTLSWANRQFENINNGNVYPARYDRRHDLSIVLTHKFNDRVDIGGTWVFSSGNAVTLATHQVSSQSPDYQYIYLDDNIGFDYFEGRNNYRMPNYHRLDLGVNFHKQKKDGIRTWSFGLYNAYNRLNPFYLVFGNKYDPTTGESIGRILKQKSLLPIMPSISYNFKF